jgi:hypothetical protein
MSKEKNPSLLLLQQISRIEAAKMALMGFEAENGSVIEKHERLRDEYNSAIEDAGALYKMEYETLGPVFGDFKISKRRGINGKRLVELLPGAADFVHLEYKVDLKEYDKYLREGVISQDVANEVEFVASVSVTGPKKA